MEVSLSSRIDGCIPYNGRTGYTEDSRPRESPMASTPRCRIVNKLAVFDQSPSTAAYRT